MERTINKISPRFLTITFAVLISLSVYIYGLCVSSPKYIDSAALAFAFQMGCWAFAWILLAASSPNGYLRISDPGVLVLLWIGMYFIYPSLIVLQGQSELPKKALKDGNDILVLWLHGLFILGFIAGYLALRKRSSWITDNIQTEHLGMGWALYLLPFIPLILELFLRLATGGTLLPSDYWDIGSGWTEEIAEAKAHSPAKYFLIGIYDKFRAYFKIIQAIGAGLILTRTLHTRKHLIRNGAILLCGMVFSIIFGFGSRSSVITVYIIAVIFTDILIGPLRWRYLFLLFILAVVGFEFWGYFRSLRDAGLSNAASMAYQDLFEKSLTTGHSSEFVAMYAKEVIGLEIFSKMPKDGIMYLFYSIFYIIPSQIFPWKSQFAATSYILAVNILGKAKTAAGAGIAGAITLDGYRFAGILGVPLLAAIMGGILSMVQNWGTREVHPNQQGPVLMKIALISGLYGVSYLIIRNDLASLIYNIFYFIFIPWVAFTIFIGRKNKWGCPTEVIKSSE
jgi:hypothetical protein